MGVSDNHSWIRRWHSWLFCIIALLPVSGVVALSSASDNGKPSMRERGEWKPATTLEGNPEAGRTLFEQHCVTCHGPRGRGDGLAIAGATVADLSSPTTQRKLSVDLLTTIHEGRPGKVMPSWGYRLSKEQSRDVLAYVRTLRRK